MPPLSRDEIAQSAARELRDGMYVNLGIGMPTLVADFVAAGPPGHAADEKMMLTMCSLPLAAVAAVPRIITYLAVLDVTPQGLVLLERAPGVSVEEIQSKTEPRLLRGAAVPEMTFG